jgi:hypothetical protein
MILIHFFSYFMLRKGHIFGQKLGTSGPEERLLASQEGQYNME